MLNDDTVFEKNTKAYLTQLNGISFESIAGRLGARATEDTVWLSMLNTGYAISPGGIAGPDEKRPSYDICVILCKYLLLCPEAPRPNREWVGYRDVKDAGPLTHYFSSAVEGAVGSHFSGKLGRLKAAAGQLGGYPPALDIRYDLAAQFDALPMVPLVLLFNDADDEFPATGSILFERRAEDYLDAECLAMLGHLLVQRLKQLGT